MTAVAEPELVDPPHLAKALGLARSIIDLAASALGQLGMETERRALARCPLRLPGTPLCTLRALQGVDTVVRMAWGGEGMLPSNPKALALELVALASAAVLAVLPGLTEGVEGHLAMLLARAHQVAVLARGAVRPVTLV